MDLDDDMPPELVETGQGGDAEVAHEKPLKVPITIVTGELSYTMTVREFKTHTCRLPRSRKDHSTQPHIDCSTWQKDCCNYE